MDQEQVIKLLSERLDTYDESQLVFVDCVSWFADDFSRFKKAIVNEILRRIRNPPILPQKRIEQPILPLYYLVDAISKNCDPGYSAYFGEKLPQVFEQSLYLNDQFLNEKLSRLVVHWKDDNIFNESVIELLQESIKNYKNSNGKSMNIIPTANPLPQNTEAFNINPDQIPSNDYIQPTEHSVEIVTPTIDDSTDQISIEDQNPVIINEDERRLSREWMKSVAKWVQSKYDPNDHLVRDLDADNNQQLNEQSTPLIRLTPSNENERCISCSGTFEHCVGPNGEQCLKDAIYIKDRGYIHQRCKNMQAEDDTHELLQSLLG